MLLIQVQQFGSGTRHDFEVLRLGGKRVKTKSHKVLGANSNVCKSYTGKTGREGGLFDCFYKMDNIGR